MEFLRKLILFLLLPALVLAWPVCVVITSGEVAGLESREVVRAQQAKPSRLFGIAYSECDVPYKAEAARAKAAELLVLGTSRVLQVRPTHFGVGATEFYNAGRAVRLVSELEPFIDSLPDQALPTRLLVGLDHNFFNDAWGRPMGVYTSSLRGCGDSLGVLQRALTRSYDDLLTGKIRISSLGRGDGIGLLAQMQQSGFRADGSYVYPADEQSVLHPTHPDYQFRDTLSRVQRGAQRFEAGAVVSPARLATLDSFLDRVRVRGIRNIVAVLPPLAPTIVDALGRSNRHGYLRSLPAELEEVCSKHGVPLVDATDLRDHGITDVDFIDGLHPNERGAELMIRKVIAAAPAFGNRGRNATSASARSR